MLHSARGPTSKTQSLEELDSVPDKGHLMKTVKIVFLVGFGILMTLPLSMSKPSRCRKTPLTAKWPPGESVPDLPFIHKEAL